MVEYLTVRAVWYGVVTSHSMVHHGTSQQDTLSNLFKCLLSTEGIQNLVSTSIVT